MSLQDFLGERDDLAQIESRSARGWLVTLLAKAGAQFIQFLAMLVLARLLVPEDFGVLAMVMSVIGIAALFRDLGLSAATIRQPTITDGQINTLFWVNVGFGALMFVVAAASAPLVQLFYSDPRVAWVTVALSFNLLLGGLNTQHMALLQRNLRFADLAWISMSSVLLGNLLALLLAWMGARYWALVASSLFGSVIGLALSWYFCKWRPGRPQYDSSVWPMISFGGYLLAFNVLGFLGLNLHNLLIGWFWGAASVGYYNRAFLLFTMLLGYVLNPLDLIAPATLARMQANMEKFCQYYLRNLLLMTLVTAPIGFACTMFADDIIRVLFGTQWAQAADLLRLLGLAAVPQALCHSTGWIYLARGNSQTMMRWGMFGWSLLIVCLLVGAPFGMRGIAVGYTVCMFLLLWPCLTVALNGTGLTTSQVLRSCFKPVMASIFAAIPLWFLQPYLASWSPWLRLLLSLTGYGGLYLMLLVTVFGQAKLLNELITLVLRRHKHEEAA